MNGAELFQFYTDKRDYSGSEVDQYAQLLMTIFYNIHQDLYPLLEQAEIQGKKLKVKEPFNDSVLWDELSASDVILV